MYSQLKSLILWLIKVCIIAWFFDWISLHKKLLSANKIIDQVIMRLDKTEGLKYLCINNGVLIFDLKAMSSQHTSKNDLC